MRMEFPIKKKVFVAALMLLVGVGSLGATEPTTESSPDSSPESSSEDSAELATESESAAAADGKIKIVLVGDSTVTDNAGWGGGFRRFLTDDAVCTNTARGGRSSMSFMKEGRWADALALKGDYYLIQFGHNNEPGKPGRSTDMPTYIADMKKYVDDARAIGAKPVLATPLTRRQWDSSSPGKIRSSLAPYAEEVRKIAKEKNVPLVELHDRSVELCESLGPEGCLVFSPFKFVDGETKHDHTHIHQRGHVMFARLVVDELRKSVPELAPVLRAEPVELDPSEATPQPDAVVSPDGGKAHTTVQAAVAAVPENLTLPFVILIKPGKYEGQIVVPKTKPNVRFVAEDPTNTVLTYALNVQEIDDKTDPKYNGTGVVVLADGFRAENLTFENTSGDHGQALALRIDGDRAVLKNCRLLGWQDTLRVDEGRQYFRDCHIEGRVDFIYGSGTSVFDHCVIHSKNGGYVTAASTAEDRVGFVFTHCKLTNDPEPWVDPAENIRVRLSKPPQAYLGRPWRPYGSVTFVDCEMGDHIRPEGWHNWGNAENEKTARYAEYSSTGPGANPAARVEWSKQLTDEESEAFSIENVLRGSDNWNPAAEN
ncbi:hypothetical protein JW916_01595 [Candidatus Sumerlaeota bacterium]|nr:hypothetical protein [Candidatus Sumerlaeota bacterium]